MQLSLSIAQSFQFSFEKWIFQVLRESEILAIYFTTVGEYIQSETLK